MHRAVHIFLAPPQSILVRHSAALRAAPGRSIIFPDKQEKSDAATMRRLPRGAYADMAYPGVDEFKEILLTRPLPSVVKEYVFEGEPFVFRHQPRALATLRQHLRSRIGVSKENLAVIGSAKIGFSLNPHAFGRPFSEYSDIDVVVVDESLFDAFWVTMLKWNYPRRGRLLGADWEWSRARREDLYWGWFAPDQVRYDFLSFPRILGRMRELTTVWFEAFRSLSRYSEFESRDVSGRVYRTWRHALLYHTEGLRRIRRAIERAKQGG